MSNNNNKKFKILILLLFDFTYAGKPCSTIQVHTQTS